MTSLGKYKLRARAEHLKTIFFYFLNRKRLRAQENLRIPIIINNFNRLNSLVDLISWLESAGYLNIIIIDNSSTYEPLLRYYAKSTYKVYRCNNLGPYAMWLLPELWNSVKNNFFVYTDSDVVPAEFCPKDVVGKIIDLHHRYPLLAKIGLSLKIDDLPDSYGKKNQVISWEKQYWENKINDELYDAAIDTTFAVYKPRAKGGWWLSGARTAPPLSARHIPWYADEQNLSAEEVYYRNSSRKDFSTWVHSNGMI